MWSLFFNTRFLRLGVALAVLLSLGGLFAWGKVQQAQKREAIALAKDAQGKLAEANAKMAEILETVKAVDTAMTIRDQEREATREALRAASWTITQLRRDNAQLREWLDRPIPPDVRRLLDNATRGSGGKAVPSDNASR